MPLKKSPELPSCNECLKRKESTLFCSLSHGELNTISSDKHARSYKKGEVIFHEGDRGHGLFCIYEGKVKVHKLGHEAKEQIIRFAKEGEVLGYRSLLGDEPYNATATAIEDCSVCYIPKSRFMEVLEHSPELSFKTIQLLTRDLKNSEKKIVNVTQKPAIERIAEALLVLKKKFGLKADGITLNIILTRREIGDMASVTTETTIRTLSQLNKKGIVGLSGKEIRLIDLSGLIRLARILD